ncbi:hypothetical protein ACFRAQ_00985 [Nocardia sp. NPDC056611]|uniref:hypothetical protein n=1 Tax=unclassified Nocardia TaxID=2637762 RepID=UPI00366F7109
MRRLALTLTASALLAGLLAAPAAVAEPVTLVPAPVADSGSAIPTNWGDGSLLYLLPGAVLVGIPFLGSAELLGCGYWDAPRSTTPQCQLMYAFFSGSSTLSGVR